MRRVVSAFFGLIAGSYPPAASRFGDSSDKGKASALFQQKAGDVCDHGCFDGAFIGFCADGQEVENIRVLEDVPGQVGLWFGQTLFEIGDGLAFPFPQTGFDLHDQDIAGPAVFDGLAGVPASFLDCF